MRYRNYGWGLLNQTFPLRYFICSLIWWKHCISTLKNLDNSDTWQIWTSIKRPKGYEQQGWGSIHGFLWSIWLHNIVITFTHPQNSRSCNILPPKDGNIVEVHGIACKFKGVHLSILVSFLFNLYKWSVSVNIKLQVAQFWNLDYTIFSTLIPSTAILRASAWNSTRFWQRHEG